MAFYIGSQSCDGIRKFSALITVKFEAGSHTIHYHIESKHDPNMYLKIEVSMTVISNVKIIKGELEDQMAFVQAVNPLMVSENSVPSSLLRLKQVVP